jgi:hypothetical protein
MKTRFPWEAAKARQAATQLVGKDKDGNPVTRGSVGLQIAPPRKMRQALLAPRNEKGQLQPVPVFVPEPVKTPTETREVRAICRKHHLDHETRPISLPDMDAAKLWMIEHQLGPCQ